MQPKQKKSFGEKLKGMFSSKRRTAEATKEDVQHGDYDPHRVNNYAYGSQLTSNYPNYQSQTIYSNQPFEQGYVRRQSGSDKHDKHGTTSARMYEDNKKNKVSPQVVVPPGPMIVPAVMVPITTPAPMMQPPPQQMMSAPIPPPQQQFIPPPQPQQQYIPPPPQPQVMAAPMPAPAPLPPQQEVVITETIVKEAEIIPPPANLAPAPAPINQADILKSGLYTNNYPKQEAYPYPAYPAETVVVEKAIEVLPPAQPVASIPLPPVEVRPPAPIIQEKIVEVLPPIQEKVLPPPPPPLVDSMPQQMPLPPADVMMAGDQVLQPVNNYTGVKFETPHLYTEKLAPVPLPEMQGPAYDRGLDVITQNRSGLQDSLPLNREPMMAAPTPVIRASEREILQSGPIINQDKTTTVVEKRQIYTAPNDGFISQIPLHTSGYVDQRIVQQQPQFMPSAGPQMMAPMPQAPMQELPPAPIEQPIYSQPPVFNNDHAPIFNSGRPRENVVITDSNPPTQFLPSQQFAGQGMAIRSNLAPNAAPGPEIGLNPGADFMARNYSNLPQNSLQNAPVGTGHLARIVEYDGTGVIANDAIFPRDQIIGPATWSNPNFAANFQNLKHDPEYISRHLAENNPAKPKPFVQLQEFGKIPNPSYAGGKPFFVDMLYNPDPLVPLSEYPAPHHHVPLQVIGQKNAELVEIQRMNEQALSERKDMMRMDRQF